MGHSPSRQCQQCCAAAAAAGLSAAASSPERPDWCHTTSSIQLSAKTLGVSVLLHSEPPSKPTISTMHQWSSLHRHWLQLLYMLLLLPPLPLRLLLLVLLLLLLLLFRCSPRTLGVWVLLRSKPPSKTPSAPPTNAAATLAAAHC
jgi:hypothetical protein